MLMTMLAGSAGDVGGDMQAAPSACNLPVATWTPSMEHSSRYRGGVGPGAETEPSEPCAQAFTEPPPPPVHAPEAAEAAAATGKSPIVVEADTLEVEEKGDKVRATGEVEVQWDNSRVRAGEIAIDQNERKVSAGGGVQYDSSEVRATADSVALDVDQEVGTLRDVDVRIRGESGRFGGKTAEKLEGRHFRLQDGYFTTCGFEEGQEPDWELRGGELDVELDDYARLRGGHLAVRGVPVLYVPYLVLPTKETRQSGFLAPEISHSSRNGFVLAEPYFWAIDKSQDLTLTGVLETDARVGLDAEYRYRPSRRRFGRLQVAYYNEALRDGGRVCSNDFTRECVTDLDCAGAPGTADDAGNCIDNDEIDSPRFYDSDIPENRFSGELMHREIGSNWTAYADLHGVSDDLYLREVDTFGSADENRELRRSRRYTASRLGAEARRGFTTVGFQSTAYQMLGIEDVRAPRGEDEDGQPPGAGTEPATFTNGNDLTLQKPGIAWAQTDGSVGPFVFGIDSSLGTYLRERSTDGQRLDVAAMVGLPLVLADTVYTRAWAGGRGDAYHLDEQDELDLFGNPVNRLDKFPARGLFDAGLDVRTKLARSYLLDNPNWRDLYNSIEPFAGVRYIQNSAGENELPLFDRLDAIDGRDTVSYGVDSRFLLRSRTNIANGAFELARISLLQTYNLSHEVVDDNFSDVDLAAFIQPIQGLALRTLTSYNLGTSEVRGAYASLSWETGPRWFLRGRSSRIAAAYRYVRSDSDDDVPDDASDILESAELLSRIGLTRNISIGIKGRYDVISTKFVEKAAGITFTSSCDCWSIGLGVVERVNPDEFQVRFAIELAGLGGVGSRVTSRTTPALDDVAYEDVGFWRPGW